jgi:hypothetical protein
MLTARGPDFSGWAGPRVDNLWQIQVYEEQHLLYAGELAGTLELGRQATTREQVGTRTEERPGHWHVLVEPLAGSRARVTNASTSQAVRFPDGGKLAPQAVCERPLPLVLALGGKLVRIEEAASVDGPMHTLAALTCPPGTGPMLFPLAALPAPPDNQEAIEALLRWLQGVLEVLQSAAGSSDFFDKAARALTAGCCCATVAT